MPVRGDGQTLYQALHNEILRKMIKFCIVLFRFIRVRREAKCEAFSGMPSDDLPANGRCLKQ